LELRTIRSLTLISVCLLLAIPCQAKIIYVDADAPGANNGQDWADAFNDLQDALAAACSGDGICVEGVYSPKGPLLYGRQASDPNPANGATGVIRTADLSWTVGSDAVVTIRLLYKEETRQTHEAICR